MDKKGGKKMLAWKEYADRAEAQLGPKAPLVIALRAQLDLERKPQRPSRPTWMSKLRNRRRNERSR